MSRGQPEGRQMAVHEGLLLERHLHRVEASPERAFDVFCALGDDDGWPAGNALWQLRGLFDRAFGGVGMRRGRRAGAPLDFWRVEAIESQHLLRLRAEMKLPGRAWLQSEVLPDASAAHGWSRQRCTNPEASLATSIGTRPGCSTASSSPVCSEWCASGPRPPDPARSSASRRRSHGNRDSSVGRGLLCRR